MLLLQVLLIVILWKIVYPLARILLLYTVGRRYFSHRARLRQAGEWAIVTGGSSGIGKAYAWELAKDGLNVFILGNVPDELSETAKSIRQQFQVEVRILVVDFTEENIYARIQSELNHLSSIACLVNNVGMFYPSNRVIDSTDNSLVSLDFIRRLVYCNMVSTTAITRLVLRKMLTQRPLGATIINLSSISALIPLPYFSLYAASKAFILQLTESLQSELRDTSLVIQAVCPASVSTAMSRIERPSFFVPDAQTFSNSALDMVGVESVTNGYLSHALRLEMFNYIPNKVIKARAFESFKQRFSSN